LKFWSFQFSSCHFGGSIWGEIMLRKCFKIWGFLTLFWWRSRILDFVIVNFKCSQFLLQWTWTCFPTLFTSFN
jgi:hypothetical protein